MDETLLQQDIPVLRRGPAQDVPYDLILWYVLKIIYLSYL